MSSEAVKAESELRDQDHERQLETTGAQTAHQNAAQQAEAIRDNLLTFLTESDLQEGTKDLLRNYASKSFILGYLQSEEVTELKWELRIAHEQYMALHPGAESEVVGGDRAYINDDTDDQLKPLSGKQKLQLATFMQAIWTNITRARDMKQQEIMKTQIARTETERNDGDGDGGGLLSRIRS
jgi:hypothetical protein